MVVVLLLLIVVKRKGKEGLGWLGLAENCSSIFAQKLGRGWRSNKYQFVRQKAGGGREEKLFSKKVSREEKGERDRGATDSSPLLSARSLYEAAAGKRNGGK